jgi:hypothetical protein
VPGPLLGRTQRLHAPRLHVAQVSGGAFLNNPSRSADGKYLAALWLDSERDPADACEIHVEMLAMRDRRNVDSRLRGISIRMKKAPGFGPSRPHFDEISDAEAAAAPAACRNRENGPTTVPLPT